MTKEMKQQFTFRITRANPTDMVVILYEMTLQFLTEAKEAMEAGEKVVCNECIRKVRGCINELIQSLHLEYEIAVNLYKLYMFCIRRLAYAQVREDVQALTEIEGVLSKLKDAYAEVAAQNPAAPVRSNAETVYSGFTYGKGALAEDMSNQSTNRGMLV